MNSSSQAGRVVAIVGPTAVGKSDTAIAVAQQISNCEIVNADSMQLYRGLTIGTGKLLGPAQGGVTHHLLDIWPIEFQASVQAYQSLARLQIQEILDRGATALLVGGSGLYVNSVLDDMQFPGTDPQVRAKWESRLATCGPNELHAELARLDPAAAVAILPGNGRRIVRALEVIEITGQPFTARLGQQKRYFNATVIGLQLSRDILDRRIEDRIDAMWAAGWVNEVAALRDHGLAQTPTASRALGYQQILSYLVGDLDESAALDQTRVATRRFARKQMSWFGRDPATIWLDAADPKVVTLIVDILEQSEA